MTPDAIAAVIERKKAHHPELASPLRWDGLRRILDREGVLLGLVPLSHPAMLTCHERMWIILVNSALPARRHTYYAAHELGHLWLHVDQDADRWQRVYHMDPNWQDDPREDDAELFAQMVLGLV